MTIAVDLGRKATKQTNKSTSRYLDDLLNIDNPYFEQMVGQIYPTELQLNKANSSDTEAPFLDMNLSLNYSLICKWAAIGRCWGFSYHSLLSINCNAAKTKN